jgi:hypothetical protein
MLDTSNELETAPYISLIKRLLAPRLNSRWSLDSNRSHQTKVAYTDINEEYPITSLKELIAQSTSLKDEETPSICIIENISREYVEALGTEWGIDPMFFVDYASNPAENALWWSNKWSWKAPEVPEELDNPDAQEFSWSEMNPSFLGLPSGYLNSIFQIPQREAKSKPCSVIKTEFVAQFDLSPLLQGQGLAYTIEYSDILLSS